MKNRKDILDKKHLPSNSGNPPSNEQMLDRINNLEKEVGKTKRLALVASILAVIFGGGGMFGVIQWMVTGPAISRELNQVKLDKDKFDLQTRTSNEEINRQLNELKLKSEKTGAEASDVKLVDSKIAIQTKLHNEEVNSIKREIEYVRAKGDQASVSALAKQLAERERAYRAVLEQLVPAFSLQGAGDLGFVLGRLIDGSRVFEEGMRNLAKETESSRPLSSKLSTIDKPIVLKDLYTIRFPARYKVTIEAQGSAKHTIVLAGSLPPQVTSLTKIERLGPEHPLVLVALKNGEQASFITPNVLEGEYINFVVDNMKVVLSPLKDIRGDKGTWETGEMRAESSGKSSYVELTDLREGFKIKISWSIARSH